MQTLHGMGAGQGEVMGKVAIGRPPETDEIMATVMTSPDDLNDMARCIGWITQRGGRTCHAAVVARSMQKPCIVGLGDDFRLLRDGMFVKMNADTGIITIIE